MIEVEPDEIIVQTAKVPGPRVVPHDAASPASTLPSLFQSRMVFQTTGFRSTTWRFCRRQYL